MATNNDGSGNGTTSKTARVKVLAAEVAEALEVKRRGPDGDGAEFICLRGGSPGWMSDLVHTAHDDGTDGGMGPDDVRYEFIQAACEALAESDDPDEVCLEPSVYTSDLTRWLGSRADRFGYCDQTLEESGIESLSDLARAAGGNYGISPTISLLALGMAAEQAEVLDSVRSFLETRADEESAADESDSDDE
jgi:hypothetical protein